MTQEIPEGDLLPDANASHEAEAPEGDPKPTGSEADPSPAADPKPTKDGRDIRIDELTRRLRETERRYDRVLRIAEERNERPTPVQETPKPEPAKTLKDFNYDEGAFTSYLEDRVSKIADKAVEAKLTEAQKRQQSQHATASFRAREAEFAKTVDDYTDVAHFAPITNEVAELVKELGSPEVAYHLGKNPDLAEKISGMSERAAALELGRLDVRLAAEREKLKARPPVSKAPPPAPTIAAAGDPASRVSTTSPESDKLSDEEWVKAENARLKRKAQKRQA